MSNKVIYTELRTRYITGWTPVLTEYQNETFTKPGSTTNVPIQTWARFFIFGGEERQLDIGSELKSFRTPGEIVVQLFAPLNTGTIVIRDYADIIAGLFRNWCGATVTCREATIQDIGADGFGWYQVNIRIPFKTDVLH
jgi:hypothetical protein